MSCFLALQSWVLLPKVGDCQSSPLQVTVAAF
jgi:hypothetical protein